MPNLVAQVKRAINDSDTALVADLYDAKFCTRADTVALLHFDDSPTKDECGNSWTLLDSDTSITSNNAKFGSALFLKGSSGCVYSTDKITLGGRDFTIDGWHYLTRTAEQFANIFRICQYNFSTKAQGARIYLIRSNDKSAGYQMGLASTSTSDLIGNDVAFSDFYNTFVHFAVVYEHNNSTLKLFANGTLLSTIQKTLPAKTFNLITIGVSNILTNPARKIYGTIDEFRIVDGVAVWTENFTPPTEPYKLVDGHIPCRLQGSTQRLWAPFNFIKTDLTPAEDTDTTVADSDTT